MSNELLEKLLVTGVYEQIVGKLLQSVLSLGNSTLQNVLNQWVKNCIWEQRFKIETRNPSLCGHICRVRLPLWLDRAFPCFYQHPSPTMASLSSKSSTGVWNACQKYKEKHCSCVNSCCHWSALKNSWWVNCVAADEIFCPPSCDI